MSILANTINTLETDILEAQNVLAHLRSLDSAAPKSTKPKAKVGRPRKKSGKEWTPEHRANFIKAMKKAKRAKAKTKGVSESSTSSTPPKTK